MTRAPRAVLCLASLALLGGCGSSSSDQKRATAPATTAAAATPPQSPEKAYAQAQAHALGRVDYAANEVLYLNAATTGPAVLGQKLHSLTAAARTAARAIVALDPPVAAAALQRREVAQMRAYARRLDAWVRTHPKRTVITAADEVHAGRQGLDKTLDALDAKGLLA